MPAAAPTLTILMPVYNERERVEAAIERALGVDYPFTAELLVVDDGSTDGTAELVARAAASRPLRLLRHERNAGKGAAIRTGLGAARGEYTGILDADLEYRPEDLVALLEPLLDGRAAVAFGVRGFRGHTSHSYLYVLGNRLVTLAANVLFNVYLEDLMTGHKAARTDVWRALPLRENGFAVEAEIAAQLVRRGERIFEVPVEYVARAHEEGKKLTARDGLRVLRTLVRCRLGR